ncbi:MAG: hypothetical protein B6I20_08075 [Bacteroidetes bacterium 4572_117]|nr:MAG: hypothetical protein B6I20_08075 [Bacteroidetes bacterium 4572_117]
MRTIIIFFISLAAITVFITACEKTSVEKTPTVDLGNKQDVIDFYISDYEGSHQYGVDWTGSTSSCSPGTISDEALANTLKRVNYFRISAGLPAVTHFDAELNAKCQKGALMMYANQELSHIPPATWSCYTQDGANAASHSNIATNTGSSSITSYMSDHGQYNYSVGHRRWILYPPTKTMGHGSATSYSMLWVAGGVELETPTELPEFISWPPKGYVPYNLIFDRWSFSIAKADFSNTSITMTDKSGNKIQINVESIKDGYGDNTIVWVPDLSYGYWGEDETKVHVELKNVKMQSGDTKNFEYDVVSIRIPSRK